MTPRAFLEPCGWVKGVGPNFYLPNAHPHLHLGLTGGGLEIGNVGDTTTHQNKKNAYAALKPKISFLAISNGGGGGAINFILNSVETKDIKNVVSELEKFGVAGDAGITMKNEMNYILGVYGHGL